ncbi:MAG: chorismate-binding protein [Bacteroidetes bacterium]|nr:chorismate-binding protein [Bacteroidota bacterium]
MPEAFFAYRLPDEHDVHFLKGDLVSVQNLSSIHEPGIIIHSFSGDRIFFLKNHHEINSDQFETHLLGGKQEFISSQENYLKDFEKVIALLNSGEFQKLILSRIKEIKTVRPAIRIFEDLNVRYTNTFNYIFSSAETGTWIGASPELLLKDNGTEVSTVSLAGTKPADGFSEWTSKEKHEQKIVTDFILDAFHKRNFENVQTSGIYTAKAGPVEHLKTAISARSKTPESFFGLLQDLHPTPATCGIPKTQAIQKITQIEKHDRKFYTGYIGLISEKSKTVFVNLRCLELQAGRALIYVGGGITPSSVGISEWIETERKSETLLPFLS